MKDPSSGSSYVAESAVKFEGKSYLKYLHGMDEDHQNFRLSLSFKTFQERGLLASTNSTRDWGLLQVSVLPFRGQDRTGGGWEVVLMLWTMYDHVRGSSVDVETLEILFPNS